MATLSTVISDETKELLERFCKSKGLRMNHVIEKAILEYIEDEMDNIIIDERDLEELVEWKKHG